MLHIVQGYFKMATGIINKVINLYSNIQLFVLGINKASKFTQIGEYQIGGIIIRGYLEADLPEIKSIFSALNTNRTIPFLRTQMYKLVGSKILFVAMDPTKDLIVGMDMFYFNKRDLVEGTIHEGFIGILPEYQGRRIATNMRQLAKTHFSVNGIKGISTRISSDNTASLKSAISVGFRMVEEYYDEINKTKRYYLVAALV